MNFIKIFLICLLIFCIIITIVLLSIFIPKSSTHSTIPPIKYCGEEQTCKLPLKCINNICQNIEAYESLENFQLLYETQYLIVDNDKILLGNKKENCFWTWDTNNLKLCYRDFNNDKNYFIKDPIENESIQITLNSKESSSNIKLTKDGQITSIDGKICLIFGSITFPPDMTSLFIWKLCVNHKPPIGAIFIIEIAPCNICGKNCCPLPFQCNNNNCNYCPIKSVECPPGLINKCIYDNNNYTYKNQCVLQSICANNDIECNTEQTAICNTNTNTFYCKDDSELPACVNISDDEKSQLIQRCRQLNNDQTVFDLICDQRTNYQWQCYPKCNIPNTNTCPSGQINTCVINPITNLPQSICRQKRNDPCVSLQPPLNCPIDEVKCFEYQNTGIWLKKCRFDLDINDLLSENTYRNLQLQTFTNILDNLNKIIVCLSKNSLIPVEPTFKLNDLITSLNYDDDVLSIINNPKGAIDTNNNVIYLASDFPFTDQNTIDHNKAIVLDIKSIATQNNCYNITCYQFKNNIYIEVLNNDVLTKNLNNPPYQLKLLQSNNPSYHYFQNYKGENVIFNDNTIQMSNSQLPTYFNIFKDINCQNPLNPYTPFPFNS
jgi:hypothetical protein